jgi:hypothetical protein
VTWQLGNHFPLAQALASTSVSRPEPNINAPDFFKEFLPAITIERDTTPKGPQPFEPFDFQREILEAWVDRKSTVWLKRRQIGASWMMCAYALYRAAYHKSTHVGLISRGQRYADELMRRIRYIEARLPVGLRRQYHGGVQRLEFHDTGSLMIAFPSNEDSGISFTFDLIVQDEAALHPYAAQNYGAFSPALDAGGQLICTSTANPRLGQSGFFFETWNQALEGELPYVPIFSGRHCRPDQGAEWWEQTAAKYQHTPDAMSAFYPETWSEAFVGKSGLALPAFNPDINVRPDDPMEWGEYDWRLAAVDPGGGDPTAAVVIGAWRDRQTGQIRYHQPENGEFYHRDSVAVDDIIQYLAQWPALDRVYVDTAGGSVILNTLNRYGFPAWPAVKDREFGLALYNQLLSEGSLTHNAGNTETIAEYPLYHLVERVDPWDRSRYRTSTPVDNHADAKDCTRYILVGFRQLIERSTAAKPNRDLKIEWSRS